MKIRVLDIRLLPGNKATRGFADVRLDDIVIRDFRIYQTNGKPSVRNPFTAYRDHGGNLSFRQILDLPSDVQVEVNSLILSEYFRRLKERIHEHDQR
jgi:DNA-binding cell septation regulator SpoVG